MKNKYVKQIIISGLLLILYVIKQSFWASCMKIVDIHIGQEIKKIVEEKFTSYSEFGRRIGKSRQNIQSQIFSKKSLIRVVKDGIL